MRAIQSKDGRKILVVPHKDSKYESDLSVDIRYENRKVLTISKKETEILKFAIWIRGYDYANNIVLIYLREKISEEVYKEYLGTYDLINEEWVEITNDLLSSPLNFPEFNFRGTLLAFKPYVYWFSTEKVIRYSFPSMAKLNEYSYDGPMGGTPSNCWAEEGQQSGGRIFEIYRIPFSDRDDHYRIWYDLTLSRIYYETAGYYGTNRLSIITTSIEQSYSQILDGPYLYPGHPEIDYNRFVRWDSSFGYWSKVIREPFAPAYSLRTADKDYIIAYSKNTTYFTETFWGVFKTDATKQQISGHQLFDNSYHGIGLGDIAKPIAFTQDYIVFLKNWSENGTQSIKIGNNNPPDYSYIKELKII